MTAILVKKHIIEVFVMICSVIGGFGVISDHCNPYFREYMVTLVNTVNEIIALGYNTFMSKIVNECDRSFF